MPSSCSVSSGKSVAGVFDPACQGLVAKNILLFRIFGLSYISLCPVPPKGRFAIVTDAGRDAVDADGASDEGAGCGRRSRVVLAPRRRRQVLRGHPCGATETNQPDLRGEHEVSRKTIARGMPGVTGVTCMLVCAFYSILHTRPWGASSARHSLRPFRGRGDRNQTNLAQQPAAGLRRCVRSPPSRASRVAGRGRGWGVVRQAPKQRFLRIDPHPRPLRASFARLDPAASRGEGSAQNMRREMPSYVLPSLRGAQATKQSTLALRRHGLLRGACHRRAFARSVGSQ